MKQLLFVLKLLAFMAMSFAMLMGGLGLMSAFMAIPLGLGLYIASWTSHTFGANGMLLLCGAGYLSLVGLCLWYQKYTKGW